MKTTIKKILKEENNRFKNYVINSINTKGYTKTAKELGFTTTEVAEVTQTKIPINIAAKIIYENFLNGRLPNNYKGYIINVDTYQGVFEWVKKTKYGNLFEYITFFATPLFEGTATTPIEINMYQLSDMSGVIEEFYADGEIYDYFNVNFEYFDDVKHVFNWYGDVYLPTVYKSSESQIEQVRYNLDLNHLF